MPTSSVPRTKAWLLIVFSAVCAAQDAAQRPLFWHRALVPPGDRARVLKLLDPDIRGPQFDQPLREAYGQIEPERSLLIHDCTIGGKPPWCDNPSFSFKAIFARAGAIANLTPNQTAQQWYALAPLYIPGYVARIGAAWNGKQLDDAPFVLLAVVNRMDLATWDSANQKWQNAELRFVYGTSLQSTSSSGPADITLIIEFVLPDLRWPDFRTLAGNWQALSASAQFSTDLSELVAAQLSKTLTFARLRTNMRLIEGKTDWTLVQWVFQANSFAQTPLTDQILHTCVNAPPYTVPPGCANYLPIWSQYAQAGSPKQWPISDSNMLEQTLSFSPVMGMPAPASICNPDLTARNVLALQQCSYCHGAETTTDFRQIRQHALQPSQGSATLSCFLTGKADATDSKKAAYQELIEPEPSNSCQVPVSFSAHLPAAPDGSCAPQTLRQVRIYSDLARRLAHLGAVLQAHSQSNDTDVALIQSYGPDYTH
jgi:hypothetical protein